MSRNEPPPGAGPIFDAVLRSGALYSSPSESEQVDAEWNRACEMFAELTRPAEAPPPAVDGRPQLTGGPPEKFTDPAQLSCPRGFIQLRLAMPDYEHFAWLVNVKEIAQVNATQEMPEGCDIGLAGSPTETFTVYESFDYVKMLMRAALEQSP